MEYLHLQHQHLKASTYGYITATAQAATAIITAKSSKHRIYVQKVTLSITTHANGKVALTLQSSNASPVPIVSRTDLTAAAGVPDTITWDFGPTGIPIALGENLNGLWSTGDSGPTGCFTIEAYQKLEGTNTM